MISHRFCSTSIHLIWYQSQSHLGSSASIHRDSSFFCFDSASFHLTFIFWWWWTFCRIFIPLHLLPSACFVSLDRSSSCYHLNRSSRFGRVTFWLCSSLCDRVDRVCLRLCSAWSRHCQSWQFVMDRRLSQIDLLSINVDRVSTDGVRCRVDCAAEFVCVGFLRFYSACFRSCAIPIRVDRVFFRSVLIVFAASFLLIRLCATYPDQSWSVVIVQLSFWIRVDPFLSWIMLKLHCFFWIRAWSVNGSVFSRWFTIIISYRLWYHLKLASKLLILQN